GYSAYSREVDWEEFKKIADEVGAYTFADIAHTAGLIAAGEMNNPVPIFDVVSTTTHKTLRGPRGAMIMCKEEFAKQIDRAVFPGMQGGPHDHINAAKAVAFKEALKPEFKEYAKQVIKNAKVLGQALYERGVQVVCPDKGFTKSHTLLVDISNFQDTIGLGADVEQRLEQAHVVANRNLLPWDIIEKRNYLNPGGIRIGTQEITRLGMKEADMVTIADFFKAVLVDQKDPAIISEEVTEFRKDYQKIHYGFETSLKAYEYIKIV
ncbi:MAG: aminotransferase class I/II-fold pyridoxal phosphate-dependent enzyme, partial [Candidatus Heimdallarchaeota archaeon]|nr:aminotransferase class I/II-fold pyridoxal phosphate-dependent enzyme [Candidatus Heimdallarchaeota archaeon]